MTWAQNFIEQVRQREQATSQNTTEDDRVVLDNHDNLIEADPKVEDFLKSNSPK